MQRVLFTPRHSHRAGGGESAATRARAATTLVGIVGGDGASEACDLSDDLVAVLSMEDGRATGAASPLMLAGIVGSGEVGVATSTTLASVAAGDEAGVVRSTSGSRVAVPSREDGRATCAGRGTAAAAG